MITKKNILAKTHYGLKVYSFILKQHFPEEKTILFVNNNDCKPTYNPFLPGKHRSLKISTVNNQTVYKDLRDKNFKGGVFDFAQLHFKTATEDELLIRINDTLHLGLESKITNYESNLERIQQQLDNIPDSQWNPRFSYFKNNLFNLYPSKTIGIPNVYRMIKDTVRKYRTDILRGLSCEEQQGKYKRKYFDYVTFSGVFTKRSNHSLIKHSELLTVDIDGVNSVNKLEKIKAKLLGDHYFDTELLFTSPRGKGLKWIIKIALDEVTHVEYFKAVTNYLQQTYGIKMDTSGSDVSRGCLLPYDPEAYIHSKYILNNDENI